MEYTEEYFYSRVDELMQSGYSYWEAYELVREEEEYQDTGS